MALRGKSNRLSGFILVMLILVQIFELFGVEITKEKQVKLTVQPQCCVFLTRSSRNILNGQED